MNEKFTLEAYHILKAFDLAIINLNLLTSFNKIYKFDQNFDTLRMKMDELAQRINGYNLIKVVSELQINDKYPIDYEPVSTILELLNKILLTLR